jgi:hypothetical protein
MPSLCGNTVAHQITATLLPGSSRYVPDPAHRGEKSQLSR